jgi:hypothetical protein
MIGAMLGVAFGDAEARDPGKALLSVAVQSGSDLTKIEEAGVTVYARLNTASGPALLIDASDIQFEILRAGGLSTRTLDPNLGDGRYYVVYMMPRFSPFDLEDYGDVLYEDEKLAIC